MPKLMTGSGYFSFDDRIEDFRAKLTWAEFLAKHREQLESIADITRLGILWDHPYWMVGHPLVLRLKYTGAAKNHKDAAADLGRIMDALQCTDLRLKILSPGRSRPESEYRGECRLGKTGLELQLSVGWLPEGCHVHTTEGPRTYCTSRSYSVYCQR